MTSESFRGTSLRVGVAGFGSIGVLHAQVFNEHPEIDEIVVADPAKNSDDPDFKALSKSTLMLADFKDLANCDIVVIALPIEMHLTAVDYFASKKVAMLIEKPLGLTYSESKKIFDIISKKNVKAMCGLTGLYHPDFHAMYKQLDSIGELVKVDERLHEANPNLGTLLGEDRGALTINGIHTLHRFYKIAKMKNESKQLRVGHVELAHKYFRDCSGEDAADGTLYLGNVPFTFHISFRDGSKCDNGWPIDYVMEVVGSKGIIKVTGYEKCEIMYGDGRKVAIYEHPDGKLGNRSQYTRIFLLIFSNGSNPIN